MKIRNIIIFIFSVFTLLGILSIYFPQEGITYKATTLTFPQLSDILKNDREEYVTDNSTIKISDEIKSYLNAQKESEDYKQKYIALKHPHAISFPKDSIEYSILAFHIQGKNLKKQIRNV